jgi:hypothetical protein
MKQHRSATLRARIARGDREIMDPKLKQLWQQYKFYVGQLNDWYARGAVEMKFVSKEQVDEVKRYIANIEGDFNIRANEIKFPLLTDIIGGPPPMPAGNKWHQSPLK